MKHSLKNKLLALLMAVMLLCGVSPIGALAEELDDDTPAIETAELTPEADVTPEPEEAPEETPAQDAETPSGSEEPEADEADIAPLAIEPSDGDAAASSVTVTFAASETYFIFAPDSLTVEVGTAKECDYGDNDQYVSVLDVLVAAHLKLYDDFETKSTDYLALTDDGFVTKAFGLPAAASGFMINGKMSKDAAPKAEVSNGDTLRFFLYQDSTDYSDYYAEFTESSITTLAGDGFGLQLVGHSLLDEMYDIPVKDEPLAGAYVAVCSVNADGSLGSEPLLEGETDKDGSIKVTIDTAGDYLLTVSGGTADGNLLVLPWCHVTVGGMAALSFAAGSSATAAAYEMTPAFSADETEYTVTVPDNKNVLYAKMTLDSGVSSTLTAKYKDTSNANKTVVLRSGQNTQLPKALSTGNMTGVDISISVGSKTYTIHVVRAATLKSFALTDAQGNKIAFTPNFSATKYEYEANFSGTELKLTPTATSATNSVNVNDTPVASGTAVTITPVWENHEYTVTLTIGSGSYRLKLKEIPTALAVAAPPTKTEYAIGEKFDPAGMTLTATYANGETETLDSTAFTVVTSAALVAQTEVELSYRGVSVTQPITMTEKLTGAGTEAAPYILATAADLELLSRMTNAGESFAGKYFEITDNITLPNDWTPIGKKGAYFSGSINGKNHLITVPSGSQTMIGAPFGAKLENLDIYGENINGNGVVAIYTTGKTAQAIEISHVTLKSGTHTTGAGFVGGYASGGYKVYIHDCTVESGVVIGDGTGSRLGSFGGDFNGTIENCVSYATVKGVDYIGGISGSKGQSMADYKIINCAFYGTVEATGNYVGGIAGGGYDGGSFGPSANTPSVTIQDCTVSGTVKGGDRVGGIFGGEPYLVQCWSNGIGYIQNNEFTGSITSSGTYVGGVIGYMNSLNKYTIIENNVYLCTGADKGIGGVKYVDTSCQNPTPVSGVTYFNTANGQSSGVSGASRTDHNRTDDPLGADKENLATSNAPAVAVKVLIDAIGTVTAESESAIAAARSAYNKLDPEEQAKVSNYAKLTAAESALAIIRSAAAVDALIDAIGEPEAVTKDSKAAIEAARAAYDALGDAARAIVTRYDRLTAAERRLAALDPQGSTKVIGTGDTKLVLDGVTYMVDAEAASLMKRIADLRDAGGMDDDGILDAYRTYDSMSKDLKAQVFNYAELEALCTALGVRGHRSGDMNVEGLPWYVGIEAEAIEGGDDYDAVAGSIGRNELLALWHIAFIDRLTGDVFVPYDTVTLRVAAPECDTALSSLRMAQYADGRVAYSDCSVANGELSWTVAEGGVYGFIGGTAVAAETLAEEDEAAASMEEPVAQTETEGQETALETTEPVAQPEDNASFLWPWIAIGLLGVVAVVVVIVLKRKDRKAQHAARH